MENWQVRRAEFSDISEICRIHNQGIEDRIATLDVELHTLKTKEYWFNNLLAEEILLVYESKQKVMAFAALTRYSVRKCYDGVGVLSIYVEREVRGNGIGSILLEELIKVAREEGYRKIILRTFVSNLHGINLYKKIGFTEVGIHKNHGLVDGLWVDILVMELLL